METSQFRKGFFIRRIISVSFDQFPEVSFAIGYLAAFSTSPVAFAIYKGADDLVMSVITPAAGLSWLSHRGILHKVEGFTSHIRNEFSLVCK